MKTRNTLAGIIYVLAALALVQFSNGSVAAQDRVAIKTAGGYLHVQNTEDRSFTLELNGKTVTADMMGENPGYLVDGRVVQVVLANTKEFVPVGKKPSDNEILELHRGWETEYLSGLYGQKIVPVSQVMTVGGRNVLSWYFVRSRYTQEYDRDLYLAMVVGKYVVILDSPLHPPDKIDECRTMLEAIFKTIDISEKPFDIKKLSDQIRNGAKVTK